jgi:hypothetical protein
MIAGEREAVAQRDIILESSPSSTSKTCFSPTPARQKFAQACNSFNRRIIGVIRQAPRDPVEAVVVQRNITISFPADSPSEEGMVSFMHTRKRMRWNRSVLKIIRYPRPEDCMDPIVQNDIVVESTRKVYCPIIFSVRSVNSRAQKTLQVVRLPHALGLESKAVAQRNIIIGSKDISSNFIPKWLPRMWHRPRPTLAVIRIPKPFECKELIVQRDITIKLSPQVARGISFSARWPSCRQLRKMNTVMHFQRLPESLRTVEKGFGPTLASMNSTNIRETFTPHPRSHKRCSYIKSGLPAGCESAVVQHDHTVASSTKLLKNCVSFFPLVWSRRRQSRNHLAGSRTSSLIISESVVAQHDQTIAPSLRSLDKCVVFLPRSGSRRRRAMKRFAPIRLPHSMSDERAIAQRNYYVVAPTRSLNTLLTFSPSHKSCVKKSFKHVVVIRLRAPLGCERVVAQRDYSVEAPVQSYSLVTFVPRFTQRAQSYINLEVNRGLILNLP